MPFVLQFFTILVNLLRGILSKCIQFFLLSRILSKTGVIFNSCAISILDLKSVQFYPAVLNVYLISAATIFLATLAVLVRFSLSYNKAGKDSVMCNLTIVFLRISVV